MLPRPALLVGLLLTASPALAGEFRSLERIPAKRDASPAPAGFAAIDPELIRAAVNGLMAAWNTPRLADWLGADYYDRDRVLDAIDTLVPRDARLRVLAIESIQTLTQAEEISPEGRPIRKSRVSVLVRTALEFNDAQAGFVRLEGLNDYLFEIKENLR